MNSMNLTGRHVPFMIGVPSVTAKVLGIIPGPQYYLRQEYDTQNDKGEWIHVINEFQRSKDFIDRYWLDNLRISMPKVID